MTGISHVTVILTFWLANSSELWTSLQAQWDTLLLGTVPDLLCPKTRHHYMQSHDLTPVGSKEPWKSHFQNQTAILLYNEISISILSFIIMVSSGPLFVEQRINGRLELRYMSVRESLWYCTALPGSSYSYEKHFVKVFSFRCTVNPR
jgi:hypothetical protein